MQTEADRIDEWRWREAEKAIGPLLEGGCARQWAMRVSGEVDRLVRENITPPEPVDELEECVRASLARIGSSASFGGVLAFTLRTELAARGLVVGKVVRVDDYEFEREVAAKLGAEQPAPWAIGLARHVFTLAGGIIEENADG